MAETSETIATIGCGLIGESWSALFTAYGHEVTVWDRASPALAPLLERIPECEAARDDAITRIIDGRGEVGHARD
jgi:3-hydroxyisobutyrate dehydrogenase-like beta-hydroxyacid dehydrogenase